LGQQPPSVERATRVDVPDGRTLPKKTYDAVIPENGPIERPVLYISRSTKLYEQGYQAT
jgi:hypothetical protein